jgi:hypothetical protein
MNSWSKLVLLAAVAVTPLAAADRLGPGRLTLGRPSGDNLTLLTGPDLLSPATRPLGQLPQTVPPFVTTNTGTLTLSGTKPATTALTLGVPGTYTGVTTLATGRFSFSPSPSDADLRLAEGELESARAKYEAAVKKLEKLKADREAARSSQPR